LPGRRIEEKHSPGGRKASRLHETPVSRGRRERKPDVESRPDGSIGRDNGSAAPRQVIQRRIGSRASRQYENENCRPDREGCPGSPKLHPHPSPCILSKGTGS
jgi:hypothetical protein